MKRLKKVLSLLIALILCVSLAAPAFAASTACQNRMATFEQRSSPSTRASVGAIQRFLVAYNATTRAYIVNAGGVDQSYGGRDI